MPEGNKPRKSVARKRPAAKVARAKAPRRAGVKRARRQTAPYARVQPNQALASEVDKTVKAAQRIRHEIEAKIERGLAELKTKKGKKR